MEEEYINFGDEQINKQDLLKAIGDYKAYSSTQPWSAARRGAFDSVIELALNRGILGTRKYTNPDTGESMYYATFGGDPFDINTYDKNTRRGWQDAAGFIGKLAESLPTKKSIEEKKKKEEEERIAKLPTFDSNSFLSTLYKNISDKEFGGQAFDGKTFDMNRWNTLDDVRNEKGAVGTDKRKEALAKYLENIDRDFNAGEYNWENSPFKDADDFKSRLGEAVRALRSEDLNDDTPALNKLGINYKDWFNNRTGEVYTTDEQGNPITYGTYYRGLQAQKDDEAKLAAGKQKAAQQKAYENTLFFNRVTNSKMLGQNAQALKEKYKDSNTLLQQLQNYAQNDIRTLSPDEQSEIQGAYRYLAKSPIDNKLLKQLQSSSSGLYRNAAPNRFKKINGIDNLVWDSIAGQVIQINTRQQQQAVQNQPTDLFADVQTQQDKEQEFLNSKIPGITNAEWKELSAIGLDVASIINPEAITGSAMALGAAGLRHSAKNDSNPNWSLGDYFWQGIDYLTGALGGIQVAGDLVLSAKTMATASKAIPILRKMARLGAWTDLYQSYPDLKEATRKITSGEELTVKDWRAIGQGIRGLVSHGRLNRGNRAERRVLEKSGQNITPENISSMKGKVQNYSQKLGFTRTKPTNTSEISIIKATVNGKESEIEISSNAKARIQEKVQKAGNNTEARNKAVKEVLESEGKIKASDKIEVEAPSIRDGKYVPRWLGTSRNLFGTKQVSSQQGNDVFKDYISGNRSYWDRYKYGSNTELKGIYNRLNGNNSIKPTTEQQTETPKANKNSSKTNLNTQSYDKNTKYEYNILNIPNKNKSKLLQKGDSQSATLADGKDYRFVYSHEGDAIIMLNGKPIINAKSKNQKEAKEIFLNFIKDINNKVKTNNQNQFIKRFESKYLENIRELKRKGFFLKQGGTIDKQRIQRYKEFIRK